MEANKKEKKKKNIWIRPDSLLNRITGVQDVQVLNEHILSLKNIHLFFYLCHTASGKIEWKPNALK